MTATHPDSSLSLLLSIRVAFLFFDDHESFASSSSFVHDHRSKFRPFYFVILSESNTSRNSSRVLERVERFQGRGGLTGEEACEYRETREKCEEEGIEVVTSPTRRVHFPRRGGVDSLCVLGGPGPRFLESRNVEFLEGKIYFSEEDG